MTPLHKATVEVTIRTAIEFDMVVQDSETLASVRLQASEAALALAKAGMAQAITHRRGLVLDESIKRRMVAEEFSVTTGRIVVE